MGNNVLLYLDDIQHCNPEFLQKFISLCDGQRRIEGVWRGRSRTYDLRGRKFAVVMAGNPYTESGDKFQIPDMLANRADTYNLGDILGGHADAFELSYLENCLTSNSVLNPLASRSQQDVYRLLRIAEGEDNLRSELEHAYSAVELEEICTVFRHLRKVQRTVLAVNQLYIESAATADDYRTEPPFKLQGSYRNMAKLAEKVVAVMQDHEVTEMLLDHYAGESQTLTSEAEANLLRFKKLLGVDDAADQDRWSQITSIYRRKQEMSGAEDDPVQLAVRQLVRLNEEIGGIAEAVGDKSELKELIAASQQPTAAPQLELGPVVKALEALTQQAAPKAATNQRSKSSIPYQSITAVCTNITSTSSNAASPQR